MIALRKRRWALYTILAVAVSVAAAVYGGAILSSASAGRGDAQDLTGLERRISLLEQRFYSVEASINRLEQQSRLSQRTPAPSTADRTLEINLLRGEIETLQRRLSEAECALVKLDERTLAPAAREARRRAGAGSTDPCRLSADAPLKLSARP